MKKLFELIKMPFMWLKVKYQYNKRIKELRKRDPFIYK